MSKKLLSQERLEELKTSSKSFGLGYDIHCMVTELDGGVIHFRCPSIMGASFQLSRVISAVLTDNPVYELAFDPRPLEEDHTTVAILIFKKKEIVI